ncbi:YggS family pyridoxal phosphate-dependent enzyme [Granulicella cerasi]|uniref:Pyridoxal phosphate homeostasis protein n=1 Tax=Granulicella cerasi TaxID=741063 RepID=A0ABW1Z7B7_9BACT|nr:YggS family pyridoxal phosphate-dependent enzyme [Granulicella cerasi]
MSSIAENLERVRDEIATACAHAGRSRDSVALMAVSKTHPAEAVLEAIAAGQKLFGENRVQEFAAKREGIIDLQGAQFHLIGPLQSNKTTRAAELFDAFDALDSLKIAERLNATCATLNKRLGVFIEVKLSHEESKHGLSEAELPALLEAVARLPQLQLRGLMTVPPFTEDPEGARPYFARLRALRDANVAQHPTLTELSMGMSHDFRVAIEEGSTTVRVGTAIFGKRETL